MTRRALKWETATTFPGLKGLESQARDVPEAQKDFFPLQDMGSAHCSSHDGCLDPSR